MKVALFICKFTFTYAFVKFYVYLNYTVVKKSLFTCFSPLDAMLITSCNTLYAIVLLWEYKMSK